jgi:hypothetical protein
MKNRPTRGGLVAAFQRNIPREFEIWSLKLLDARFNIWAERALQVVWNEDDLRAYDRWLRDYAQAWLDTLKNATGESEATLPEKRALLLERMSHWKAEARSFLAYLAQGVERKATKVPTTTIGQNIDSLRKECGWSYDKLAAETGIDKKLILSHVNKGAKPVPRILKEYAQAFSKALGRTITAPDLEKWPAKTVSSV